MLMEEVKNEFILDCLVRNLAPRTSQNFKKQILPLLIHDNKGNSENTLFPCLFAL